jgi:OHCU decarboxylase
VKASDLGDVFERAPALAERVARRAVGDDLEAILTAAREELDRMSDAEKVGVLDAHPRIGADPASLSPSSYTEQGEAADAATRAELERLNDNYERRFGFRFVVFVNGRSKSAILPILRQRLARSREEELATGLDEFLAISRDRLERRG